MSQRTAEDWHLGNWPLKVGVDEHGYPLPRSLWDRASRTVRISEPKYDQFERAMVDAAHTAETEVRHAIGMGIMGMSDQELGLWWASHVAAEYLEQPWGLTEALAASFSLAGEKNAPGPGVIPKGDRLNSLAALDRSLGRVFH